MLYRLSASSADSTRWLMQGLKIVGTDTIDMGPLEPTRDRSGALVARLPMGMWKFDVRGDSLTGALVLVDGSVMRRVQAKRLPSS